MHSPTEVILAMQRLILALGLWLLIVLPLPGQQSPLPLDPTQAYRPVLMGEAVTYDVEFVVAVTAPEHTQKLKVWLPIPPSDNVQAVKSREINVFPDAQEPTFATENVYGNRFAYFEFEHPQGAQIITHKYQVTTHALRWNV